METAKKILHVDMDAFYASVEIRDNPAYRDIPIVVGGRRGVVLTANYLARQYGVKSGIPSFQAAQLCGKLTFVKPRYSAYQEASDKIREIFSRYTDVVEPRSLDEAYLDVTNHKSLYAVQIAKRIQTEILEELRLTCSVGISWNKMLAKIASDWRKPHGMTLILPEKTEEFMLGVPLRRIPGIGPSSEQRLLEVGLKYGKDVIERPMVALESQLGRRYASWLRRKCLGKGSLEVGGTHERKSIGRQRTFGNRMVDFSFLSDQVCSISESLSTKMRNGGYGGKTVTLVLRYSNLQRISRSYTLPFLTNQSETISKVALALIEKTEALSRPVRLVGVSITNLADCVSAR